jgi:hypothetical protein
LIFFQNNIWYILKIEYGDEKKKIFEKWRECQMNRKEKWNIEFNLVVFLSKRFFLYYLILVEYINLFDIVWYLSLLKGSNFFGF